MYYMWILSQRPMRKWFSIYYAINMKYHTYEGMKLIESSLIRSCCFPMSLLCLLWPSLFSQSNPSVICTFCSSLAGDFTPHADRSDIQQRRRHLVNISLHKHRQIPLFEKKKKKSSWEQAITLSPVLFSSSRLPRLLLPASPPSARSERRYRTTELQMPPIRPGVRSEALSGPFCLILLRHGADERISHVRELHSITNLSLHLLYQGESQWVI